MAVVTCRRPNRRKRPAGSLQTIFGPAVTIPRARSDCSECGRGSEVSGWGAVAESTPEDRPIIGWREWLALPGIGIDGVKAKVDTGARSSALHAFDVEEFVSDGKQMVRFKVHPFQRDTLTTIDAVAELADRRQVRSSQGHLSLRPVIVTELDLAGRRCEIEVTLVRRDAMGFRMLLGREAVRRRFVVDPGRSYVTGRRKTRRRKKKKRKP